MVDLESLATAPGAAIVSIGAVFFDREGLGDRFKVNVSFSSLQKAGFTVNANTVGWWFQQTQAVRDALLSPTPVPISDALNAFTNFLGEQKPFVWGNGATFDNVILRSAYEKLGKTCPWQYRKDACFRTLKNIYDPKGKFYIPEAGTAHDSLTDALRQATQAVAILQMTLEAEE